MNRVYHLGRLPRSAPRPSRTPMPSLYHDYPMPAWTATLAVLVILASTAALYAISR